MTGPRLAALAARRQALLAHSRSLRTQLTGDVRAAHAVAAQRLGLGRVLLAAAGVGMAAMALRRRGGWRRLHEGLRLLPLAWGLWRTVRAARRAR